MFVDEEEAKLLDTAYSGESYRITVKQRDALVLVALHQDAQEDEDVEYSVEESERLLNVIKSNLL